MASQELQQIDFKKYRTTELVDSISELVNLREIFVSSVKLIIVATVLFVLFCCFIFWQQTNLLWLIPVFLYSCVAGVCISFFFAIAEVIRRSIDNMLKIVDLLLVVTERVATDARSLHSGNAVMPSAQDLVRSVYDEVFSYLIKKVLSETFWILGGPLNYLYQMTFERLLRKVIQLIPDSAFEPEKMQKVQSTIDESKAAMAKVAASESTIIAKLEWTRNAISHVGGWFRFLIVWPSYAISLLVAFILLLPLVVAYYLSG